MTQDPTTAAIANQIEERDRLRAEIDRLSKALVAAYTDIEVLTAERDRFRSLAQQASASKDLA